MQGQSNNIEVVAESIGTYTQSLFARYEVEYKDRPVSILHRTSENGCYVQIFMGGLWSLDLTCLAAGEFAEKFFAIACTFTDLSKNEDFMAMVFKLCDAAFECRGLVSPTEADIDVLAFTLALKDVGTAPSEGQCAETKAFILDFFENYPDSDKIIWLWERQRSLNAETINDLF